MGKDEALEVLEKAVSVQSGRFRWRTGCKGPPAFPSTR